MLQSVLIQRGHLSNMHQSVRETFFADVSFGVPVGLDVLVAEMHVAQLYSRSKNIFAIICQIYYSKSSVGSSSVIYN
jgi:hypothetical protein